MKYYKALRTNRASFYDESFKWPLKKPVEVVSADTDNGPCGVGLHLAKDQNAAFKYTGMPSRLFEAKPLSPILGEDNDKIRVAKAKLTKEITPQWLMKVNRFLKTIPNITWFSQSKDLLSDWNVFDTRAAAGDAARDAAWNAAGDAAGNAAWAAAGNAARDAAGAAAWAAAGAAAGDAAGAAARDAAWNAAGAAKLLALCLVVHDKIEKKHLAHAKARWNVWQRGYGLACDINGQFYVYKQP